LEQLPQLVLGDEQARCEEASSIPVRSKLRRSFIPASSNLRSFSHDDVAA
jgi:hypothetical protein